MFCASSRALPGCAAITSPTDEIPSIPGNGSVVTSACKVYARNVPCQRLQDNMNGWVAWGAQGQALGLCVYYRLHGHVASRRQR
jgi:hypothetical protein